MNQLIRERENGKFQAIISYKDGRKWKQKSKGGFETKKEAKEWIKVATYEILEIEKKNIVNSEITFKEVCDFFLEDKTMKHCSAHTIRNYKNTISFFSEFHNIAITKITAFDLQKHIFEKRKNGKNYNRNVEVLKNIFNFAISMNLCNSNPAKNISKVDVEDKRIKFIDINLYNNIMNSFKKKSYKLFFEVLYNTGLRFGEALGITQIDLVDNCIIINNQYSELTKKFEKLKTNNSKRVVPISEDLFKKLKSAPVGVDGRIFFDIKNAAFNDVLRAFGTSAHCLRHTYITKLVSAGIDPTIIASVSGDTIPTILNVYAEINKDNEIESRNKIRSVF